MTSAVKNQDANSHQGSSGPLFVANVFSELSAQTMQNRWPAVNVILRLAMLSGLQMQLDASLHLVADFAAEMVPHQRSLLFFWDEDHQGVRLREAQAFGHVPVDELANGNLFHLWAAQHNRPLLIQAGQDRHADALLQRFQAASALVIPLFVSNRVMGSLQLFAASPGSFSREDAQLLWIFSLVAEVLLTQDYVNEGLIRFAFTDYLTGLKTRGYFEQQLELEIKRSERKQTKFSLLMIDIDLFKHLNDHYGHHVGDQLLRDVASLLMKDMREVDTVARYGGEEFVIVLPETWGPGARLVAERLRRVIEQSKFFAGSPDMVERITISIGISVFDHDGCTRQELIEAADAALYAAKAGGRNRVVLYSECARQKREVS